jgi:hypothetical protein
VIISRSKKFADNVAGVKERHKINYFIRRKIIKDYFENLLIDEEILLE